MSIGVALAGGGLKGIAYVGALKALEELGVKIDYLSATSSGSLIATFYAMGLTPDEIQTVILNNYKSLINLRKRNVFKIGYTYALTRIAKVEGIMPGENIEKTINKVIKEKNINLNNMNEVKLPFAIVTCDTITTKECIFLSQDFGLNKDDDIDYIYNAPIATATRASMAFPGLYSPCQYKQYNFIDGGTKDNLPVKVLKKMGADKVLALSFKIDEYVPKKDLFGILLRTVDIFSLKNVREAQKEANLALEIDCNGTTLLKITDADEVVKIGYNTIINNKEKILNLLK